MELSEGIQYRLGLLGRQPLRTTEDGCPQRRICVANGTVASHLHPNPFEMPRIIEVNSDDPHDTGPPDAPRRSAIRSSSSSSIPMRMRARISTNSEQRTSISMSASWSSARKAFASRTETNLATSTATRRALSAYISTRHRQAPRGRGSRLYDDLRAIPGRGALDAVVRAARPGPLARLGVVMRPLPRHRARTAQGVAPIRPTSNRLQQPAETHRFCRVDRELSCVSPGDWQRPGR